MTDFVQVPSGPCNMRTMLFFIMLLFLLLFWECFCSMLSFPFEIDFLIVCGLVYLFFYF